ncbi:hypothetical protein AU184_19410 [Mycolicibacterium novocastrense]|nr:hypothetical protein AU184_19410 [Mycolicibacterium novocastrense]KUH71338.1 hypothetical protein AU183_06020 [Mycolicibacterium novocastrense]KUH74402.1 hypothetical protein AU072_17435 [Mycolicibacterium novocastrense]
MQTGPDADLVDVAAAAKLAGVDELSSPLGYDAGSMLAIADAGVFSRLAEVVASEEARLRDQHAVYSPSEVTLLAPILRPEKFICIGLNYRDHAAELGLDLPAEPMFFGKFANSLIGTGATIVPPAISEQIDYEAELAVVIGKRGKHIPEDRALDHVAGVMPLNDVSARDLQMSTPLWTSGKAIDTFAPAGPALVRLDEIPDVQALPVIAKVNGQVVQDSNTSLMIFSVAELVAFLSRTMTLSPGDIIATGTPAGVSRAHGPKTFLRTGDVVEINIGGVGVLSNPVGEPEREIQSTCVTAGAAR